MFHFKKLVSHFDKFSPQKKNDAGTLVIITIDIKQCYSGVNFYGIHFVF